MIFDAYSDSALLASFRLLTSLRRYSISFKEPDGSMMPGSDVADTLRDVSCVFLCLRDLLRMVRSSRVVVCPSSISLFSARPSSAARSKPGPVIGRLARDSP